MLIKAVSSGDASMYVFDANKNIIIHGFSYSESAASAATAEIRLYHGEAIEDNYILPPVNFAADGFGIPHFFPQPIQIPNGLYLYRVSGETTVIIYYDIVPYEFEE